jgi:integrase/recombinase XerD
MTAPSGMMHWIQSFLEAQAAELDAATNTQLAYARDLKDFADWLDRRKHHLKDATQSIVENYLISCEAEGLAVSTRARRLSAIKQLYRFAFEEGWRSDNPAVQIKGPGKPKRLPKTLGVEDVDRLLHAARTHGRETARNTCLMELLYATGMRVTELVSLPIAAARGNPQMLLVRGKGGKERMVPLSAAALNAISDWLDVRDRGPRQTQRGSRVQIPLSLSKQRRPPHPSSVLCPDQRACRFRRDFPRKRDTPHHPPCLRYTSVGRRS